MSVIHFVNVVFLHTIIEPCVVHMGEKSNSGLRADSASILNHFFSLEYYQIVSKVFLAQLLQL